MTKAKAVAAFWWVAIISLAFWVGFMGGFYEATGGLPIGIAGGVSIVPPDVDARTGAEARQALEPLQDEQYREGFNCMDYAWAGMRLLHWAGQTAMIVKLDLDPDPDHAVLIVSTSDEGWIFLEPQNGQRIYPRAGGKWASGQDIIDVSIMAVEWVPLDQYESDDLWHATNDTSGIGDVVSWPADDEDGEEAEEYAELSTYVTQSFIQLPLIVGMLGLALWKKGWLRVVLSLCIVIWGAYYTGIDMKMAAPMIATGMILFFSSVLTPRMVNE